VSVPVKKPKATWLKPVLPAEIAYGGVTDDGLLREAVFKGLREDLMTQDVKAPSLAPRRTRPARKHQGEEPHIGVPRANILQLLPDAVVPSKEELAAYWRKVSRPPPAQAGAAHPPRTPSIIRASCRRCRSACISSRLRRERAAKARACGWMISTG
jgi:hypothetical protein